MQLRGRTGEITPIQGAGSHEQDSAGKLAERDIGDSLQTVGSVVELWTATCVGVKRASDVCLDIIEALERERLLIQEPGLAADEGPECSVRVPTLPG